MLRATTKRIAASVVIAGSLLVGVSAIPAIATPAAEAVHLAGMKQDWKAQKSKVQRTTCFAYRTAPKALINTSIEAARTDTTSADELSKPAWRRVIKAYLAWACSGPGTTPR